MVVMPLNGIIDEIDAYLLRLRQARELLWDRRTKAPQKRAARRKSNITLRQANPAPSRRRPVGKNKSRSNRPVAHLKRGPESIETGAHVPNAKTHHASHLEQPAIAQPERAIPQTVVVKRLPSKGPTGSTRSVRHRTPKSNPGIKPDAAKPAIALSGPAGARVVVVPPEQVRREREQAVQPKVQRPRVIGAGLAGRLAFEALFK
jgi:hypothetical protein